MFFERFILNYLRGVMPYSAFVAHGGRVVYLSSQVFNQEPGCIQRRIVSTIDPAVIDDSWHILQIKVKQMTKNRVAQALPLETEIDKKMLSIQGYQRWERVPVEVYALAYLAGSTSMIRRLPEIAPLAGEVLSLYVADQIQYFDEMLTQTPQTEWFKSEVGCVMYTSISSHR